MTRSKRNRNARQKQSQRNEAYNQTSGQRQNYAPILRENAAFEDYYKSQKIVSEDEWETFISKLRAPLPSTFRITGNRSQAAELLQIIKGDYLSNLTKAPPGASEVSERKYSPPKSLSWYPDELAWQLDFDRRFIRQSATLKKLHQFLVSETESGNISRQEAVSMLPPLVLDVHPHHKVLDMCAAPGSKTAQLIELLHANNSEQSCVPSGFVVANDSDNKRCYLMVHQVKRLESPNFLIINHDAANLPNITLTPHDVPKKVVRYDRILADVPCSGDGTLRKNPDVWLKWNPAAAHNLHFLQIGILRRGFELLEIGGRLVYSTCSFNPIENEAVIAHCLQMAQGGVELLDVSSELTGLKYDPGLTTWKVMSRKGVYYEDCADLPDNLRTQIRESMFPPATQNARRINLNRCVRVLPHHQDTGGFFIAVMRKVSQLSWLSKPVTETATQDSDLNQEGEQSKTSPEPANENPAATIDHAEDTAVTPSDEVKSKVDEVDDETEGTSEDRDVTASDEAEVKVDDGTDIMTSKDHGVTASDEADSKVDEVDDGTEGTSEDRGVKRKPCKRDGTPPPLKRQHLKGYKEDPFVFLTDDEEIWPPIKEFYGISDTFPVSQLFVRCKTGKKRTLYFVSEDVKRIVEYNKDTVRFINLGLKIFGRSDSVHVKCSFRLAQDGIHTLAPYIRERRVPIVRDDIVTVLSQENPFLSKLTSVTQEHLSVLDQGSLVFIYEAEEGTAGPSCRLVISGWLGRTSCRSFLPRHERAHYLRLCGEELRSKEEVLAEKAAKQSQAAIDDNGDVKCEDEEVMKIREEDMDGERISEDGKTPVDGERTKVEGVEQVL